MPAWRKPKHRSAAAPVVEARAAARRSPLARADGVAPRRLGDLLVEYSIIDEIQLRTALDRQVETGAALGEVLVAEGLVTHDQLLQMMAIQLDLPYIDLRQVTPEPEALASLPESLVRDRQLLPYHLGPDGELFVVSADPDAGLVDELVARLGRGVILGVASGDEIGRLIEANYRTGAAIDAQVKEFLLINETRALALVVEDVADVGDDAPAVRVVDLLFSQAVRDRASDIHIEPRDDAVNVRLRVDGALNTVSVLPASMAAPLCGRIKVLAGMNIVERRRPQDGQISTVVNGSPLDVRVSTVGTVWGEKVVMRLLGKDKALRDLAQLGLGETSRETLREALASPFGMVVCAGPTGSGKTTTLYAALQSLDSRERSIVTIEDPVEYVFPSITQIPINEQAGVTFAGGLRAVLRQDPDVVLVGEIRDEETARIAIQAALTGHLVLSSIHATDAVSALTRFIDMGVEPFLVASAANSIVGQRLARRICTACRVEHELPIEERDFWAKVTSDPLPITYTGRGCSLCFGTGYLGRIGLYEVLSVDEEIADLLVKQHASNDVIRAHASARGMSSLRQEALAQVRLGVTSVAEVIRTVHLL